ncbi:hypothetical protein ABZ622_41950 [Streptomyces sp. NPDC007164]|uniref:hypothetical protein n=1 Tax=Streptomyces sp. NPDC007164 TaxID=3156918 RepID=UPI0033C2A168
MTECRSGYAEAREVAAGLREAMDDVRRSVAVLAARVREAHAARVWLPIGELMLEVAPAHLSDTAAADVLALLCEEIGEPLEHGLTARRYAMSGDRRALHSAVL